MDLLELALNLLLIVLGFGFLIFIHELGHFLAAKWAGIRTEAFAIGMGPVALSWRRGIGLVAGSTHRKVMRLTGKPASELKDHELAAHGLGETEYSLRWLPLGGFVKMLGQEDANPSAVSDDPRSYTRCPVPRRMVVVSAGVLANIVLAVVLFVIAFMVGVRFEDAVIGQVSATMPAGVATAINAAAAGIAEPGLQPGDRITHIDGEPAETFADIQIASAMSRPGNPLHLRVERPGVAIPLDFTLTPRKDGSSGLLAIGVAPASSTRLLDRLGDPLLRDAVGESGLTEAGVSPGMRMLKANGHEVQTYEAFERIAARSGGQPVETVWARDDTDEETGTTVTVMVNVEPELETYLQRETGGDSGLLGFSPLVRISGVEPGSLNSGVLREGDVIARLAEVDFPRRSDLFEALPRYKRDRIPIVVLRDGERTSLEARVSRGGRLEVAIRDATDLLISARPIEQHARHRPGGEAVEDVSTPVASAALPGGVRINTVNGAAVDSWARLRAEVIRAVSASGGAAAAAPLTISITHPTPGGEREDLVLELPAHDLESIRALAWTPVLPSYVFEPLRTTRSADGNPVRAVIMGFEETHKAIMMTYLTLDRLFRRSVGVEQLRGPVGIVHLGTHVAQRGFTYLIFFLAMISVNLAVINFLPMPIVDGGLFLFLVYERFKGRPPSLAFQNAATIIGLCLIGAIFLITFYNDVMRLLG